MGNQVELVNLMETKMINEAHFCTSATHFIFRVGGYYADKIKLSHAAKVKYDMRLSVFDTRTHQWDLENYG